MLDMFIQMKTKKTDENMRCRRVYESRSYENEASPASTIARLLSSETNKPEEIEHPHGKPRNAAQ